MDHLPVHSKNSIIEFFITIIRHHNIVLFPDVPFCEYEDENGKPRFTVTDAAILEEAMIACFRFCDVADLDIYELAGEAQVKVYKEQGLLPQDFGRR